MANSHIVSPADQAGAKEIMRPTRSGRRGYRQRVFLSNLFMVYVPAALLLVFVITPFLWMFLGSFKSNTELMSNQGQTLWIEQPTFQNYVNLFREYPFARFFLNSTIVATFTTAVAVSFAAFAGYSISRFRFPGRMFVGIMILATQMIPGIAILIPLYVLFNKLHLLDSYQGLIVSYNAFAIPFCTWMIKGFFDSIPSELEEAALMDGCNRWGAFWRIALPLSLPGLLATSVFAFILGWHEFIFAATFVNKTELKTLTVGIASMKSINVVDWGLLNAGAVVVSLPLAILFAFVQRYLVQGLTAGAVKG